MPQRIREHGWLQGAVMPPSMYADAQIDSLAEGDVLILVSQSCDVVSGSFDAEPTVEFIVAKPIPESERDGNFYDGKNPRHYEFLQTKPTKQAYRLSWHNRIKVDRRLLAAHAPAPEAFGEQVIPIAKWIGRKYTRLALPDTFNDRLRPAQTAMRNAIKNSHTFLSHVFISLNSLKELNDGQNYTAMLVLVVTPETYADTAAMKEVARVVTAVEGAVAGCSGIQMVVRVKSEEEVSLSALKKLRTWDTLDYLSD